MQSVATLRQLSDYPGSVSDYFGLGVRIHRNTHPLNNFNGLIDEPTLYARALSSAEILALPGRRRRQVFDHEPVGVILWRRLRGHQRRQG